MGRALVIAPQFAYGKPSGQRLQPRRGCAATLQLIGRNGPSHIGLRELSGRQDKKFATVEHCRQHA
ncbi:MAG: hypothetical protein ABI016_14515, partial [Chthoniobacterales bacterium]